MQLADRVATAVTVGFGGALLGLPASAARPAPAVAVPAACLAGIALVGVCITQRWPTHG
ncbi:MAG TPA: hypothetical protein VFG87_24215 [Amycolatopsis sp.]|jgi:hypothetical protein|nr:hypothetical protein [Amycolatopsis sp.]